MIARSTLHPYGEAFSWCTTGTPYSTHRGTGPIQTPFREGAGLCWLWFPVYFGSFKRMLRPRVLGDSIQDIVEFGSRFGSQVDDFLHSVPLIPIGAVIQNKYLSEFFPMRACHQPCPSSRDVAPQALIFAI